MDLMAYAIKRYGWFGKRLIKFDNPSLATLESWLNGNVSTPFFGQHKRDFSHSFELLPFLGPVKSREYGFCYILFHPLFRCYVT